MPGKDVSNVKTDQTYRPGTCENCGQRTCAAGKMYRDDCFLIWIGTGKWLRTSFETFHLNTLFIIQYTIIISKYYLS